MNPSEVTTRRTPRERVLEVLTAQPQHVSQVAVGAGIALSLAQTELQILQAEGRVLIQRGFAHLREKSESAPPRPKPGTPEYVRALVLSHILLSYVDRPFTAKEISMSLCEPERAVKIALRTLEGEERIQYMEDGSWSLPGSIRVVEEILFRQQLENRLANIGLCRKEVKQQRQEREHKPANTEQLMRRGWRVRVA